MRWKSFIAKISVIFAISTSPLVLAQGEIIKEWIDSETGHRVIKVTDEPYSTLPYFTSNSVSADKKFMAYSSPKGLHLIDLQTFATRIIVPRSGADLRIVEMGRESSRLYFVIRREGSEKYP